MKFVERSVKIIGIFLIIGLLPSEFLSASVQEECEHPVFGVCPDDSFEPPLVPTELRIEVLGFEPARLKVPDEAWVELLGTIEDFKVASDGVVISDVEYTFDIIRVKGKYSRDELTEQGKDLMFSDIRLLGLENVVEDLNNNGRLDKADLTNPLLGELRVHALNLKLENSGLGVNIRLDENIQTESGEVSPASRGVVGFLSPSKGPAD